MAALAHERYTAFLRSEVYAQRCSHYAPATAFRLDTQGPIQPISAMLGMSDVAAPEVPQRAARRTDMWVPERPRVFAEEQEEGTKRVLSVRNG